MSISISQNEEVSMKLFVVLSKAYKAVADRAIHDMKKYGLSPSAFMILEVLFTKGRIPLQQIGEKVLITSGSITYNIDRLEKKALLKRVPSSTDRRVIYAELTDEGRSLFNSIFPEHAGTIHALMQGLSMEEQEAAIELLKRLGRGAGDS